MTKFSSKLHRCFRDDNGKFYNSHLKNKSVKSALMKVQDQMDNTVLAWYGVIRT